MSPFQVQRNVEPRETENSIRLYHRRDAENGALLPLWKFKCEGSTVQPKQEFGRSSRNCNFEVILCDGDRSPVRILRFEYNLFS